MVNVWKHLTIGETRWRVYGNSVLSSQVFYKSQTLLKYIYLNKNVYSLCRQCGGWSWVGRVRMQRACVKEATTILLWQGDLWPAGARGPGGKGAEMENTLALGEAEPGNWLDVRAELEAWVKGDVTLLSWAQWQAQSRSHKRKDRIAIDQHGQPGERGNTPNSIPLSNPLFWSWRCLLGSEILHNGAFQTIGGQEPGFLFFKCISSPGKSNVLVYILFSETSPWRLCLDVRHF